jgi:hypothetical protein
MTDPLEPVFVVGCQRSGSTMLGAMLGGSPEVVTIPEAQFVADLLPAEGPAAVLDLAGVIDRIEGHYRFRIWQYDLAGRRPSGRGSFADAVRWLVRDYAVHHGRPDARLWVDHQPGHVRYLARLAAVFPKLKAIHLVRDGRAVAASLMPLDWGPNTINRAAYFWQQRLALGFAAERWLGPARSAFTRYEDVVGKPETELRRLADFIGVAYGPELVAGEGLEVPAFTRGQHALVGRAPDRRRIDGWRTQLSRREVEIFESISGDLLDYLGYERVTPGVPEPLRGAEQARIEVANFALKYLNQLKFRRRVKAFGRS